MIKKSIFILLIALTLGALSARAATKYEINVAGVEVTSDNKGNVTGGDIKSGTVTYDPSSNVLTLTNVTISRTGGSNYGVHNRKCDNLTIKFVGTCKIESNEANAIHLDRASTVMVTSGSTLTASMTACNNSLRGVVYVNGVTANFNGPGTLNIGGAAKSGTSNRPAGFEGTGKSSNSKINVSYITLNITTPGESFYKFGTVALSSGVDVKCSTSYGSRAVHTTGNLYFNNGVACVTPADAVFSDGMYTQNDGYWHFTDNYGVIVSTANFPDANFRTYLRSLCSSGEQYLTKAQLQNLTSLDVSNKSISDLTGVSRLTYLKTLNCSYNSLTALPTLPSSLTTLNCRVNQLTALPTLPSTLTALNCGYNQLTALPTLPAGIQTIDASSNRFTSLSIISKSSLNTLDVSNNTSLTSLACGYNALTSLSYSGCSSLQTLNCSHNQLTTLSALPATVTVFNCSNNSLAFLPTLSRDIQEVNASTNKFTSITIIGYSSLKTLNLSNDYNLTYLDCHNNALTDINLMYCPLQKLDCSHNQLTTLRTLPDDLIDLNCSYNQLTTLPSTIIPSGIKTIYAQNNKLTGLHIYNKSSLEVLMVNDNTALTDLRCYHNALTVLNYSGCPLKTLDCSYNQLEELAYTLPATLTTLNCSDNKLTALPTLPGSLTELNCGYNQLKALSSLPNSLFTLVCYSNKLTSLPTLPTSLTTLNCSSNQLTALPTLPAGIKELYALSNQLSEVNVTGKPSLKVLYLNNNKLNNLSVDGCNNLTELYIYRNQIKGSAMTSLINSMRTLPDGTTSEFYVLNPGGSEGNEITNAQVKAANAKNWHPMKYVGNSTWVEIEATDDGVRGDVTGDGLVDVADVNAVISIMLGKTEASSYKGVADVTADGIIDVSDVNAIIAITLGKQ